MTARKRLVPEIGAEVSQSFLREKPLNYIFDPGKFIVTPIYTQILNTNAERLDLIKKHGKLVSRG